MRLPFVGRRPEVPGPRPDFLRDTAGDTAVRRFAKLVETPRLAEDEGADLNELPPGWVAEDVIFLHVAAAVVMSIDWAAGQGVILDAVNTRLVAMGKPALGQGDATWIETYVEANWRERGDAMGLAYGPLAHCLEVRGLRAMAIYDGSDTYRLVMAEPAIVARWIGRDLSEALSIEDPSWQFEPYLRGTKFAEYLVPRP